MMISVITPSYNQAQFLRETIESVLAQDWREMEYIVVEGGSADESEKIARGYAQNGCLKLVSFPGSGQAQAINRGFEIATGDVIGWLNSDDRYMERALTRVAAVFSLEENAEVVYGHELSIDVDGNVVGGRFARAGLNRRTACWQGVSIPQPAVFFRRTIYETMGGLDESFDYALDIEYWLRIVKRFRFRHLPQVLAATRHHAQAKTGLGRGGGSFGPNGNRFYEEVRRAFLMHGGSKLSPFYLQNCANRHLRSRVAHAMISRAIRLYARISSSKIST